MPIKRTRRGGPGTACPPGPITPVNYEAVELFLNTDGLSDTERAMLMGSACAKAYGWSPKKG